MTHRWTRRTLLGTSLGGLTAGLAPRIVSASPGTATEIRDLRAAAGATGAAYDGRVPGPLLRVRLGTDLAVKLVNELPARTSLHWHGVRIANGLDGVAGLTGPALAPGSSTTIRFAPPDAGLYWYHPCLPTETVDPARQGLLGALIVDEEAPPPVDHDLLLVLAPPLALPLAPPLATSAPDPKAPAGDRPKPEITVNGLAPPLPVLRLPAGGRLRLRVLNASPSQILVLSFTGLAAQIVAVDGQPCGLLPVSSLGLPIGPGARFELLADLPAGPDQRAGIAMKGAKGGIDLVSVHTQPGHAPKMPPIAALPINPRLPTRIPLERSLRAELPLVPQTAKPTAAAVFPGPPLFSVRRGRPVTLTLKNQTGSVQQIRLHGHVFRVLHDLDDGWDPYWRDSLLIGPGKTKHIAFVADNPGRWLIEPAPLGVTLAGLPRWFDVG